MCKSALDYEGMFVIMGIQQGGDYMIETIEDIRRRYMYLQLSKATGASVQELKRKKPQDDYRHLDIEYDDELLHFPE